jgi:hypothetical protein
MALTFCDAEEGLSRAAEVGHARTHERRPHREPAHLSLLQRCVMYSCPIATNAKLAQSAGRRSSDAAGQKRGGGLARRAQKNMQVDTSTQKMPGRCAMSATRNGCDGPGVLDTRSR